MPTDNHTTVTVCRANLAQAVDATALVVLLDDYARDPMGGGTPLAADVRSRLAGDLAARAGTHVFIAWAAPGTPHEQDMRSAPIDRVPVGVAVCFEGYSTFAGAPLLNVHDFAVLPAARGRGVGRALLAAVEAQARTLGCCKITLEVLAGNAPAQALYAACGFAPYALDPAMGQAQFMQKKLG